MINDLRPYPGKRWFFRLRRTFARRGGRLSARRGTESDDRNQNSDENEDANMKAGTVHRLPGEQAEANAEGE